MDSKYATEEKISKEKLYKDYQLFEKLTNVKEIINALPYLVAILNPERQIVYANNKLFEMLNVNSVEELLGYSSGEAINCIYSDKEAGGCGTSESCKYCGAVNTILKCQVTNISVKDECRITSIVNNKRINFDLLVMASPFYVKNIQYIILSLNDISSEKRRKAIERIFFHDVINTAGTLKGILELMKNINSEAELKIFINLAENTSKDLMEEILAQNELIEAENNELKIKREPVPSINLIRDVVVQILFHPISIDRSVIIDKESIDITFTTDVKLLRRVLVNMLKNALEATPRHGKVKIGCCTDNNKVSIWVSNQGFIKRDIQMQIFMRSFSTKGADRGLGTYSMKLLTEKYLGGKIYFETSEEKGTKFFVKLPL
jgi:K+-sensing histidine kinase KdpD